MRQLEFALFDLRLHRDYDPAAGARVLDVLDRVRSEVSVMPPPAWNRMPNSFSHVFAGGYAAGYYSYKWAEVLSADAFAAFEESRFAPETGRRFRDSETRGTSPPVPVGTNPRPRESTAAHRARAAPTSRTSPRPRAVP